MNQEVKEKRHEHHGDTCPHCGAEDAVLFVGGESLPDGSVIDKSYICDECSKWVYPDDFEE